MIIVVRNSSNHLDFGGAELFSIELTKEYREQGLECRLISGSKEIKSREGDLLINGPRNPIQNYSGKNYLLLPLFFVGIIWSIYRYYLIFKKNKPTAIHLNSRDDFIAATVAAKVSKVAKIVWTDHAELKAITQNNSSAIKGVPGKVVTWVAKYADTVTTVSENDRLRITKNTSGKIKPLVIRNGFRDISKEIDEELVYDFCFASRLNKEKGIYELIDAIKDLQKTKPQTSLLISADNSTPGYQEVVEYVNKQQLENVHFTEYSDNSIARASIFVMPSYMEGVSLALIKACCLSRPIVTTGVGGTLEILKDKKNALFVDPKSSEDLKNKMMDLIDNEELQEKLSKNARQSYEETMIFSNIVKESYLPLLK